MNPINITININITPDGTTFTSESESADEDEETAKGLRVLPGGVGFQLPEADYYEGTYVD